MGVVGVLAVVAVIVLATSGSGSSSNANNSSPGSQAAIPTTLADGSTCMDWNAASSGDEQNYAQQYGGDGGTVSGTNVYDYLNAVCGSSSTYDYSSTKLGDLMAYLVSNGYSSQPCDSNPDSLPSCSSASGSASTTLADSSTCTDWNAASYSEEQNYAQQYNGDGGTVSGANVYDYLNGVCGGSSTYDYSVTTLGDLMTYLTNNGYSSQPCDSSSTDTLPLC